MKWEQVISKLETELVGDSEVNLWNIRIKSSNCLISIRLSVLLTLCLTFNKVYLKSYMSLSLGGENEEDSHSSELIPVNCIESYLYAIMETYLCESPLQSKW